MTTSELYVKNARVWIPHADLVWEGAELLENYTPNKTALRVCTEGGEQKTLTVKSEADLPFLRNPSILIGENDLTSLSYLHEPAVLYNLQVRFCQQKDIYTYCGIVLVAINPYNDLFIYSTDTIQTYRGQAMGDLDPHIFAVAEDAYTKLEREQRDQSIIVSGESGAGKTVSAKYAMRYFATVGGSATETQIEKKVLASSPIMEAIGNAKTTRNDNSSRFGKFIELQFNKQFHISGASMRTYLLEKSRVVFQASDERNYHIFYQLCAARKELSHFHLDNPNSFYYLNQGASPSIDGISDLDQYNETINALNMLGFSKSEQMEMFKILAGILHLGNIQFIETIIEQENEQNQEGCCVQDMDKHLNILSKLLEIDAEEMMVWLCTKKIVSMRDVIMIPMTTEQAKIARDALAKHIYAQLFDWVVVTINKVLESDIPRYKFIGVLDIYGFETFETNSFEQFCINYANEKLQQQFNLHVFKLEQQEYIKEGIEWKMIEFYDNQPCIDLIEAKLGILDLLDEECKMPKGSDRSWTEKLYSKCLKYSHFGKARFGTSAFIINHFADRVEYESNGFLEKNRDTVMDEQIAVLKSSKNNLVRKLFCEPSSTSTTSGTKLKVISAKPPQRIQKSHKKSVGSQFRDSLNLLMKTLNDTTPHYVRCVKPNDTKTPFEYNPQRVVQQLRACGVLETIRLSAAGFPSRWSYIDFFYRYRVLCRFKDVHQNNMQKTCTIILEKHIKDTEQYQFGKSKIFFRAGQVAYLEKLRSDRLVKCCIIMQSTVRAYLCRKRYLAMKKAIYGLQRYARGFLARQRAQELRRNRAAITIQKHMRRWLVQTKYRRIKKAVCGIQTYARGYLARLRYNQIKYNAKAVIIQRYVRGYLARKWYADQRRKVVICQAAIRRFHARKLYKKMKIEARSIEHVKTLNKGLENKIISLQQRIDELNKNNAELKKKEVEVTDLRSKLTSFRSLEHEIKSLNNLLMDRDRKIMELEEALKAERDEKMDIINEQERYKNEMDQQNGRYDEEMNKVRKELEEMNEIVKKYEKEETAKEKIEHERMLILNEQDSDRQAYQKLLQEYHCLEQHCEDLEKQVNEQNRQGRHARNASDISTVSTIGDSLPSTELVDDHGYSSVKSVSEANSGEITSNGTDHEPTQEPQSMDISLVLKLQHKLSEVEREKVRLQKRLDDLDTSPRIEKAENAVKDSLKISELELYNSNLKATIYDLQASITEGKGEQKIQEQFKILHEELERRSEEIVQLKSVLADQTNNMKSIVSSKTRAGEYINEDGELALAYETQKTINKQLELELQDEQAKYKAHEREYKTEIEKLREDNERQQRLLSQHLTTPQTKTEAYMQHEISRLTKENLEVQDKYDQASETCRDQRRQLKALSKKLRESGVDFEDTVTTDGNKNDEASFSSKHSRAMATLKKKDRDYLGMLSYKSNDEPVILRHLVIDLKPRTAVTLLPGLPAYIIFMCIRHIDFINDENKIQSLLSNFANAVKKVVRKRKEDLETVSLWLSNTLTLLHCLKQYSGNTAFQTQNTPKQNEQCLRNFDLSEYRQVYSDIAVWMYQFFIRLSEEKIQQLIVPAILEHEEIRGVSGSKPTGRSKVEGRRSSSINLESPLGSQKPTTALLQELSNQYKVLTFYGVDTEVISQIFKQLFYFICASSINNLLLRKELCHWSKGYNIRHNLSYFEQWTKEKNMDEQAIKSTLQPVLQASHLLQARKTDEDVTSVCEMCSALTRSQICKILTLYTPVDEFEQRVPQSFITKVQQKLLERGETKEQDNLLMDVHHYFPVRFPFVASTICLEDLEIPEVLKLPMLEKV